MSADKLPTLERVKELLLYCPETGVFHWKQDRRGPSKAGDVAGAVDRKGYRYIKVDQYRVGAHRLAWFYHTGEWPVECIDHINRKRDDNRLANLREASWSDNRKNTCAAGVKLNPKTGRWKAYIHHLGQQIYLGTHDTEDEALTVRRAAELKYFAEYAPNG